jgi:hypothetical protein
MTEREDKKNWRNCEERRKDERVTGGKGRKKGTEGGVGRKETRNKELLAKGEGQEIEGR